MSLVVRSTSPSRRTGFPAQSRFRLKKYPTISPETSSSTHPPSNDRAQFLKQLLLADRFFQDGFDIAWRYRNRCIAGHDDDRHMFFQQPIDQVAGCFTVSQINIDNGNVWGALRNQTFSVRRRSSRPDHVRSQYTKQALHGFTDVPGVLDQENAHAFQFRRTSTSRLVSDRSGHSLIPMLCIGGLNGRTAKPALADRVYLLGHAGDLHQTERQCCSARETDYSGPQFEASRILQGEIPDSAPLVATGPLWDAAFTFLLRAALVFLQCYELWRTQSVLTALPRNALRS